MENSSRKPSVAAIQGRISDRSPGGMIGAGLLAKALERELGVPAALHGTPSKPLDDHWTFALEQARPLIAKAAAHIEDGLLGNKFPILCLGECATSLGTIPVVHRLHPDARIVWFDAHGDFNTPETTTTRYLGGITLTGASGYWHTGFGTEMRPDQFVLVGARDLDPPEEELLREAGATIIPPGPGLLEKLQKAIGSHPIWVHIDCDVMDPSTFPTEYVVPGGLQPSELREALSAIGASNRVLGLEVAEFEAPESIDARQAAVATALDVIEPLISAFRPQA